MRPQALFEASLPRGSACSFLTLLEDYFRMKQVSKSRDVLMAIGLVTALLQCGTTWAQEMKPFLTLKTAMVMADAADKKAIAIGVKVHIAIVDDGGNLKYYLRQDGAPLVAEKISQMKAFTAVAMEKSTAEVGEISKAETPGIELVPNLIKFGGGIPIKNSKGQILGGIGVSGASKEEDAACAQAGLDAVKAMLN
jgi:uncharacterized protein GlcG (DUF336 family)